MKHKFLSDLGIDVDDDTKNLLNQFDLNGYLDQIADNRIKDESRIVDEEKAKVEGEADKTIKDEKERSKKENKTPKK